MRGQMIRAGVWITHAVCGATALWLLGTWTQPGRPAMAVLVALAWLSAMLVPRLPTQRIVTGPQCEAFFLAWSGLDIAFIAAIAALDGGASSPMSFVLFLTLIFAALSYPLRSVLVVCGLNLL